MKSIRTCLLLLCVLGLGACGDEGGSKIPCRPYSYCEGWVDISVNLIYLNEPNTPSSIEIEEIKIYAIEESGYSLGLLKNSEIPYDTSYKIQRLDSRERNPITLTEGSSEHLGGFRVLQRADPYIYEGQKLDSDLENYYLYLEGFYEFKIRGKYVSPENPQLTTFWTWNFFGSDFDINPGRPQIPVSFPYSYQNLEVILNIGGLMEITPDLILNFRGRNPGHRYIEPINFDRKDIDNVRRKVTFDSNVQEIVLK
jgi:hypothetical protein